MPLYRYVKAVPTPIPSQAPVIIRQKPRLTSKLIPPVLVTLGSLVLANVAWPILSHQLFLAPRIKRLEIISPLSSTAPTLPAPLPTPALTPIAPQVMGAALDYTNAKNWFPAAEFNLNEPVTQYFLDIPKVNIKDAKVIVGGEDLSQGLIHFPGTAKPGQFGAPVIFGHSTLRQFYNPSVTNSQRYTSIFSKIMTLSHGDRIYLNYDGIRYTYEVTDKVEVEPEDLFILEQRLNQKELKLITCVPEGTYLKRGVILARLVNLVNSD